MFYPLLKRFKLKERVGLEPTRGCLTGTCSATELPIQVSFFAIPARAQANFKVVASRIELDATWLSAKFGQPALDYLCKLRQQDTNLQRRE